MLVSAIDIRSMDEHGFIISNKAICEHLPKETMLILYLPFSSQEDLFQQQGKAEHFSYKGVCTGVILKQ